MREPHKYRIISVDDVLGLWATSPVWRPVAHFAEEGHLHALMDHGTQIITLVTSEAMKQDCDVVPGIRMELYDGV